MKFPQKPITCRDYRSYYPAKPSEHLPEVDWNVIYNCHDVHLTWKIFKDMLWTVFNKSAPVITKRVLGKCSQWQSAEIKSYMNTRDKLIQKVQKSKVNVHREEYKRKGNEVNIIIWKDKSNYTRTLSENSVFGQQ